MSVIPPNLLVPCSMKRIICHWSEGSYTANSTDREAYNLLVEGDGTIRGGDHPISDNVSTADGDYAAHTLHCNAGSIGIACCCMMGCNERPFRPGPKPMKKLQWDGMVQAVAELCAFYRIPVTSTTVLGHGEVQKNLGITQRGKWDPMVWPWDLSASRERVGTALREQVKAALAALTTASGTNGNTTAAIPDGGSPVMVVVSGGTEPPAAAHEVYTLRSTMLAADPVMRDIAATNRVLYPPSSSQRIDGIATVQEALNRVSLNNPVVPRIGFGPGDKFRGFFGPQTVKAIRSFQVAVGVTEDGAVGDHTLKLLDAALTGNDIAPPADGVGSMPGGSATVGTHGYTPPAASAELLKNAGFAAAVTVGGKYMAKFARADATTARSDQSRCRVILRFPDDTIFFDAKMALCVDGSPRAKALDRTGLLQTAHTIGGKPIDAEAVSYVVLPRPDPKTRDNFLADFGLRKGDLAMVVSGNQRCGAILGELGPEEKIGETSIHVHERLHALGAPVGNPWKNSRKSAIQNRSVRESVLYFVFPNTAALIARTLRPANAEKLIQDTAEQLFQKFLA